MNQYAPELLSEAVAAICPDIELRVGDAAVPDERALWWELSSCILSSQVPYALAVAAADAIDAERLLVDSQEDSDSLTSRLTEVLKKPLSMDGHFRSYRFPVARARHLALTHTAIMQEAGSLRVLIDRFHEATEARAWLVRYAPGLGPKQASMFLRNIGVSYNLAILDRHVLNYMTAVGIYTEKSGAISGLVRYCQHETVLRRHAQDFDCQVGLLDWAIWIVMRVAGSKTESVAI